MNPADLTLGISPTLTTNRALAQSTSSAAGGAGGSAAGLINGGAAAKAAVPRVDLEGIYTQLKSALGELWGDYKDAVNKFVLGHLNQAELSFMLQPLLSAAPSVLTNTNPALSPLSTLHLHNSLIAAIYANTLRDPPPTEVAPWVVATDKPTTGSKNAGASGANDKAEERLKSEVMSIHARDRRRIKILKTNDHASNEGLAQIQSYRHELAVKPPDVAPAASTTSTSAANGNTTAAAASTPATATAPTPATNTSGITKTNWDLEIRRRYAQPLAQETLEFPTTADIQNRIEPLCYEEGVVGGVSQGALQTCAELIEQATEVYLKELLGSLSALSRSNGPAAGSSAGSSATADNGIQTHRFRRQLRREEADVESGLLARNPAGLLPVEVDAQTKRDPLCLDDLRLAVDLREPFLRQDRFLGEGIALDRFPDLKISGSEPALTNGHVNGAGAGAGADAARPNGSLTKLERERAAKANADGGGAMDGVEGPGAAGATASSSAAVAAATTNGVVDGVQDWSWQGGGNNDADELLGILDDCLAVG